MSLPRTLRQFLRPLFARRVERDMDEEMHAHIEIETQMLVALGVAGEEARRRALASFGGVSRYKEEARDAWTFRGLERLVSDVRYALRSLAHSPSFTIASVLVLALAMAANTIVFSVADSVAFRPLAVDAPDRLAALYPAQGEAHLLGFSYPTYRELARDNRTFSELAAITESPVVLGSRDPSPLWAAHVSDNYFSMLGVRPELGRLLGADDFLAPSVVISHALWMQRFSGSPGVIGQRILINDNPFVIAGVAPLQFTGTRLFTYEPSVWMPLGMFRQTMPGSGALLERRDVAPFLVIGRLREDVTFAQARQDLSAFATRIAERYPELYRRWTVELIPNRTPINPWLTSPERITWIGRLLLIGIGLILLVACANVASLLIGRMAARRQEIAVRLSLGCSQSRLVQQLLTESLVLAALGAMASLPLAMIGNRLMLRLTPPLEYASSWRPPDDFRITVYAAAITILAALLFGVAPALQSTRASILRPFGEVRRRLGPARLRLSEYCLIAQVTLSVIVLAVALLFARSLDHARTIDTGFRVDGAIAFTVDPSMSSAYDAARTRSLYSRVTAALEAVPGVTAVGRATSIPLDGNNVGRRIFLDGGSQAIERAPIAEFSNSSPGFLAAAGIPLMAGRDFIVADTAGAAGVVVINETLARRLWPGEPAIGKLLRVGSPSSAPQRVVGVTSTASYRRLGERPRGAVWLDLDREPRARTTFVVRTSGNEAALIGAARGAVRNVDPALPVIGLGSLHDHVALAYAPVASGAAGAIGFAVLAMLLAISGVYGTVAYGVAKRRRELGVRIALGARPGAIVRLVVRRAVTLTASGVLLGATIVATVPMGLSSMLYGVSPRDPRVLASSAMLFCLIAAAAALIPARRAVGVDPVNAMRSE
jgi:putative ABC transport system permease protein